MTAKDPSPRAKAAPPRERKRANRPRAKWTGATLRVAWIFGAVVAVIALFIFVFPTRTYLTQHQQINAAAKRLDVLNAQNAQLAAEAQKLQSPAEIERLAREQYHMVQPGQQAYSILPPAAAPTTTVPVAAAAGRHHHSWLDTLTSWLP